MAQCPQKSKRNQQKKRAGATIRTLLLGALFYLGVALIFFGSGFGSSYLIQENAERTSSQLTAQKADANKKRKTSYDASKTAAISAGSILKAKQKAAHAIGRIALPAVGIHNPLFAGYGDRNQNLEYGVVTCLPDRIMGGANNYVLAGHYMGNYGPAVLDNLHLAKTGDMIYVTDLHHVYAYRVKRISFAIKPSQVEVENNVKDQSMITLITCSDFNTSKYGYGQHRTVVQGDLVSRVKATKKNLAQAELTGSYHSDKSGHVTLTNRHGRKTRIKTVRVRPAARSKFYQETGFIRKTIIVFSSVFLLVIAGQLIRIWRPRRKD